MNGVLRNNIFYTQPIQSSPFIHPTILNWYYVYGEKTSSLYSHYTEFSEILHNTLNSLWHNISYYEIRISNML